MSDVTQLLNAMAAGDPKAADQLLPLVYEELRKLAAARMAQERPGQTLQATALVHEAWLRLVGPADPKLWDGRGHFYAAATEAMRQILIDRARKRSRERHGSDLQRVNFEDLDVASPADDTTLLAVSEALDRLAALDPAGAELIKLRFFAGLPNVEAARLLGLTDNAPSHGCPWEPGCPASGPLQERREPRLECLQTCRTRRPAASGCRHRKWTA